MAAVRRSPGLPGDLLDRRRTRILENPPNNAGGDSESWRIFGRLSPLGWWSGRQELVILVTAPELWVET